MKKILLTGSFIAITAIGASAQTAQPTPPPTAQMTQASAPANLETILIEAAKQATNYQQEFRNLIATEVKSTEVYDDDGSIDEKRIVESNFLVYKSPKNEKISSEVRNVTKVDEKLIPDSQAKSDQFFAELEKEKTPESELKKIEKESTKYDRGIEINGLTLNEGLVLSDNIRPYFDFKMEGTENVNGRETYVISYLQTKKSPYVKLNSKEANTGQPTLSYDLPLSGDLKKADAFLRGKFLIDAQTYQILREDRDLLVRTNDPVVLMQSSFEYQPSEYEIMVPKRITVLTNNFKKKDGKYNTFKDTQVTFDYSKFRKSNVEVIILDDDQP